VVVPAGSIAQEDGRSAEGSEDHIDAAVAIEIREGGAAM
jgi:hypothetical protein